MTLRLSIIVSIAIIGTGCSASRPDLRTETALSTANSLTDRRSDVPSKTTPLATTKSEPAEPITLVGLTETQPTKSDRSVLDPPKALPALVGTASSVGGPLSLDEVLSSVEQHYPLLRSVEQERALAGGRLLTSLGAFDLNLLAGADGQDGTYDNLRGTFGVNQAIPVGGMGLFAGYRNGAGDFPTYNLGQKTADGGEFRAGLSIPLLRDREIDRPRASIRQARLDVAIAEPVIERQRLDFQRAASRTYWNWVAAGQRLSIVDQLVKLALERDDQLKTRVVIGTTANIERTDNQQNIALRQAILVQAQRAFQQSMIELSLFLRDGSGSPNLAGTDRLPNFPEIKPIDPAMLDASIQTALQARPEPRRFRLLGEKASVELRLAMNQTLPSMNAVIGTSQDLGSGKSSLSGPNGLERSTLNAGVMMQLPVQLRDARGRVQQAQAQLAQIQQQLRFAEDVVRAEVQDTFSALERAYEFYQQARKRIELARLVADAEREQLRLGRSDILRVTLREQAAFDAEIIEIGSRQEYFRALADWKAAKGDGDTEPK